MYIWQKQLTKGFQRSVYWNSYQTKPAKVIEKGKNSYELLNTSFQAIRRLFVLAYVVAASAANDEVGIRNNKQYLFFLQEERLIFTTYWLMEENFMINQLTTW